MESVSLHHLWTQTNADDQWVRTMAGMLHTSGGGHLAFAVHGVEVWAHSPDRFYRDYDWGCRMSRVRAQRTHTAKLLRGAMRFAADLDVPPDDACMALGAMIDADRAVADQMMKEGRY